MSAMALASARDTAFATIDGLTGLGLAPTPTNYSVWHSHISGENPGLSRSIQELVARAIPITDEMLSDFWRRFCAPAMDPSVVTDAGERLGRVMASIAESISGAGAATSGFTDALARFGDEIVAAVRLRKEIEGEWVLILAGLASVAFGVLLMARPGSGAVAAVRSSAPASCATAAAYAASDGRGSPCGGIWR